MKFEWEVVYDCAQWKTFHTNPQFPNKISLTDRTRPECHFSEYCSKTAADLENLSFHALDEFLF